MRIAFLCKRRYMGKDVILDRYARLYEIPHQLARIGHDVRGCCLSYHGEADGDWQHEAAPGRLQWTSSALGHLKLPALACYPHRLLRQLRSFRPDLIIGASDIPHAALAAWLAQRLQLPYAVDLYDNFEGFGQARIPGFKPLLRRAVRRADLVTTTSAPLRNFVMDTYKARGEVIVMPSTIDKSVFHPRDKAGCRRALGLPVNAKLIGTAGGLLESRGIGTLYEAWRALAKRDADIHLVLAGPIDQGCPPPDSARVHYLGILSHVRAAKLFGALDVGVIYLRDTPFGRYCFPQKAHEMMGCNLSIVAAQVGVMPSLLASTPAALYRANDSADLVRAVLEMLERPQHPKVPIPGWLEAVADLESRLWTLNRI